MKKISKKYVYLTVALLSILSLIIVNIFGVYYVVVLGESTRFFSGFIMSFFSLLFGLPFLGYEGRGTPINMLINGLFYVFLIATIVFFVLFLREILNQKITKLRKDTRGHYENNKEK